MLPVYCSEVFNTSTQPLPNGDIRNRYTTSRNVAKKTTCFIKFVIRNMNDSTG